MAGVELPMLLPLLLLWLLPLMMLPFPFPIGPPPFCVTIIPPPLLTIPTTPPILFPILLTIVLPTEFIDRDITGSHINTSSQAQFFTTRDDTVLISLPFTPLEILH